MEKLLVKQLLVVVDMQNDFIDGALGTKEAESIVSNVVKKISCWNGDLAYTLDTHYDNYLSTREGTNLPVPHCIKDSVGWKLNDKVNAAINSMDAVPAVFVKETFGSLALAEYIAKNGYTEIEFIGLCTDICVISNVMLAKAAVPEAKITVDASCCAGVSAESHNNALAAMKMCHIEIVNE